MQVEENFSQQRKKKKNSHINKGEIITALMV